MANKYNFSSDKINIFLFLIDKSGSMVDDKENMENGIYEFQKSFKRFPEVNSIAVSISQFDDGVYFGDFESIKEINLSYWPNGGTELYFAVYQAAEYLKNYVKKVTEINNCQPIVTFIVFSDGESYCKRMSERKGKETIENLNYAGINTCFIAFGSAIDSEFGRRMGFQSTIDVNDREALSTFLGVDLSKSFKEQSKSYKSLGSNFFSQAVNKDNSEYSKTTEQVIEDDAWMDFI